MTGHFESISGVRWVILNEDYVNSVVEMKTVPDRLLRHQPKLGGEMLNVLSPSGWIANEKFWSKLDEVVESGVTSSPTGWIRLEMVSALKELGMG